MTNSEKSCWIEQQNINQLRLEAKEIAEREAADCSLLNDDVRFFYIEKELREVYNTSL